MKAKAPFRGKANIQWTKDDQGVMRPGIWRSRGAAFVKGGNKGPTGYKAKRAERWHFVGRRKA